MNKKETNRANQISISKEFTSGVKLIDIDTTIAEYMVDSIIPNVEVGYNSWKFGLSYDWNTSGFNEVTNGRGGIELSAVYIFVKPQVEVYKNCNPIY